MPLRVAGLIRSFRQNLSSPMADEIGPRRRNGLAQARAMVAVALLRGRQDVRFRFLVAGGFATMINLLIRFPLDLVMPFAAAVTLATLTHMVCAFVLYRTWVFPGSSRGTFEQLRDFVLVNLIGMAITVAVAIALCECFVSVDLTYSIAAATAHIMGIAAGAVATYLGHGRVTFR